MSPYETLIKEESYTNFLSEIRVTLIDLRIADSEKSRDTYLSTYLQIEKQLSTVARESFLRPGRSSRAGSDDRWWEVEEHASFLDWSEPKLQLKMHHSIIKQRQRQIFLDSKIPSPPKVFKRKFSHVSKFFSKHGSFKNSSKNFERRYGLSYVPIYYLKKL